MKLILVISSCIALTTSTLFAQTYNPSVLRSHVVTQTAKLEDSHDALDWHQVGLGFSTAVGNLFYIPAKITYSTLGGVAGGVAYIFTRGDHRAAHDIWRNSLGGDYILTPAMIQGQHPIHFMDTGLDGKQLMTETASAQRNAAPAELPLPSKEPSGSTLPKPIIADSRRTASDFGRQLSTLPESKPPKRDGQRGNLVEQSGLTRPLRHERVPQFSIVPQ